MTRRARNLAANPAVVVHLESGDDVVILEGEAREVGKPERALAERLSAAFTAKYAATKYEYRPPPEQWDRGGLWAMRTHGRLRVERLPRATPPAGASRTRPVSRSCDMNTARST